MLYVGRTVLAYHDLVQVTLNSFPNIKIQKVLEIRLSEVLNQMSLMKIWMHTCNLSFPPSLPLLISAPKKHPPLPHSQNK